MEIAGGAYALNTGRLEVIDESRGSWRSNATGADKNTTLKTAGTPRREAPQMPAPSA